MTAPFAAAPFAASTNAEAGQVRDALTALGYAGDGEPPTAAGIVWAWTCPDHPATRWTGKSPCPICGAPPILVRKDG